MFFLSLIEHTLRLPPHLLDLSLDKTIQGELESQFLDKVWKLSNVFAFSFCYCAFRAFKGLRRMCVVMKVIADLGLCISLSIDGDFVFPADGASTYTVYLIYFSFYNLSIRDCCIAFIFVRFWIELKKAMGWIAWRLKPVLKHHMNSTR